MKKRYGKLRIGTWMLAGVVAFLICLSVLWMFGNVSGEEFSPQKFTMRRFSYWQIPILRKQIWPVSLRKVTGADDKLAKHIRMNGLNYVVPKAATTWDIVTMGEVGKATFRGDASILTNYLKQPGAAGMTSLLDWTKSNPQHAQQLWALISLLAQEDLYPVVPDVIDVIYQSPSDTFQQQMYNVAEQECRALAQAEKESGDLLRAAAIQNVVTRLESGTFAEEIKQQPVAESNVEESD